MPRQSHAPRLPCPPRQGRPDPHRRRTLADAGISGNVIAGLAHDHLFVDWDQGARALALLRAL
jgi:hypothetical protein